MYLYYSYTLKDPTTLFQVLRLLKNVLYPTLQTRRGSRHKSFIISLQDVQLQTFVSLCRKPQTLKQLVALGDGSPKLKYNPQPCTGTPE